MKKRLSVLLSIIIVLSICAPLQSVIASEIERKSVSLFSSRIAKLNEKYESDSDSFEKHYNDNTPNATENRLIVKTKNKIKNTDAIDSVYGLDYAVLQYNNKGDMLEEYDDLRDKGYTVEKDIYLHTCAVNIEDSKWGIQETGVDFAKSRIADSSYSENEIVIGVFDSGVNYEHNLLKDKITDTSFNMSDSGNENDCMDDNGHGTSVAGIIAQATPDNVKIKPYKVMNDKGVCTLSTFIAAMEAIIAEKNKPDIMNLSVGVFDPYSNMKIQTELVDKLVKCNVAVCVAAGNDNLPVQNITPANCETAITVGAYNKDNHICSFSNFGKEVDIAAPGENVFTASHKAVNAYITNFTGTSAACPFVSSACAYILMQNPKFSPTEVKNEIKSSAIYMGEDEEDYYGSGMLNFPNLLVDKEYTAPTPSTIGGFYTDTQTVTFDNIPADTQLIYTLDKSIPSNSNGTIYTSPITIDNEMQLNYALIQSDKYVSDIKSQYYTVQYIADENDFEITEDGVITAYNGDKNNIIVPKLINNIIPTALGKEAFKESKFTSIILPDTINTIYNKCFQKSKNLKHFKATNVNDIREAAFYACSDLRDEIMPNCTELDSSVFRGCSMLHEIDFSDSVTFLGWHAFENSGLLNADFSNVEDFDSEYLFYGSSLMTCNMPNIEVLSNYMFSCCNNLYKVNVPNANDIGTSVFEYCYSLENVDFPNVTWINDGAFDYCYIDTLYAPKCVTLSGMGSSVGIGQRSYIRVIDLPKLTEITSNNVFYNMYVEEIYLDSITSFKNPSNVFKNLPCLKVLYLPNAEELYYPTVETYPFLPPLEIVWLPKAQVKTQYINPDSTHVTDQLKLFFAPNTRYLHIDSYSSIIVISEKATDVAVGVTRQSYLDNVYPTIIAPKGSAAWSQWQYSDEDPIKYIDSDSIIEAKGAQIRTRDNGLRFGFVLDESVLGVDLSQYENLYKRINKEYGFAYSFDQSIDEQNENVNTQIRADNDDTITSKAAKRSVDGTVSTYNAVFTGIPTEYINDKISARAYVNIDGMYFYSPVITRSYSSASNADDYVGIEEADNDIVFVHEHSFVKSVIAPKCEEKGYTLYKCAKCNESYTENYTDALGHNYKFVSADNSKLTYKCSDCDSTVTKTKSELPIFIDYVNTKAARGNDNMYLDLNNDGYINAKDYALLNKISN